MLGIIRIDHPSFRCKEKFLVFSIDHAKERMELMQISLHKNVVWSLLQKIIRIGINLETKMIIYSTKNILKKDLAKDEVICPRCGGSCYEEFQDYTEEYLLTCKKCLGRGTVRWTEAARGDNCEIK
jgi:hypothetical protein